jgi:hypothetical protein
MFKNRPELTGALLGGGIGALGGAASSLHDDEGHRNILGRTLTGGLAGAALGTGTGLAYRGLRGLKPPTPEGGEGPAETPFGPNEFMHNGQRMAIDPAVVKAHPELAAKLQQLMAPQDPLKQSAMGFAGAVGGVARRAIGLPSSNTWVERNLPTSSWALPKIGLADLLTHAPGLNLGERIGIGRIRPQFSQSRDDFFKGVSEMGDKIGIPPHIKSQILGGGTDVGGTSGIAPPGGNRVTRAFNRFLGNYGDPKRSILSQTHQPMTEETSHVRHPSDPTGSFTESKIQKENGPPVTEHLTAEQMQAAKREGHILNEKALGHTSPRGKMRVGPWEAKMPSSRAGLLSRLALYGGLPLSEYAYNALGEQQSNENEMNELVKKFARPVGK